MQANVWTAPPMRLISYIHARWFALFLTSLLELSSFCRKHHIFIQNVIRCIYIYCTLCSECRAYYSCRTLFFEHIILCYCHNTTKSTTRTRYLYLVFHHRVPMHPLSLSICLCSCCRLSFSYDYHYYYYICLYYVPRWVLCFTFLIKLLLLLHCNWQEEKKIFFLFSLRRGEKPLIHAYRSHSHSILFNL